MRISIPIARPASIVEEPEPEPDNTTTTPTVRDQSDAGLFANLAASHTALEPEDNPDASSPDTAATTVAVPTAAITSASSPHPPHHSTTNVASTNQEKQGQESEQHTRAESSSEKQIPTLPRLPSDMVGGMSTSPSQTVSREAHDTSHSGGAQTAATRPPPPPPPPQPQRHADNRAGANAEQANYGDNDDDDDDEDDNDNEDGLQSRTRSAQSPSSRATTHARPRLPMHGSRHSTGGAAHQQHGDADVDDSSRANLHAPSTSSGAGMQLAHRPHTTLSLRKVHKRNKPPRPAKDADMTMQHLCHYNPRKPVDEPELVLSFPLLFVLF